MGESTIELARPNCKQWMNRWRWVILVGLRIGLVSSTRYGQSLVLDQMAGRFHSIVCPLTAYSKPVRPYLSPLPVSCIYWARPEFSWKRRSLIYWFYWLCRYYQGLYIAFRWQHFTANQILATATEGGIIWIIAC